MTFHAPQIILLGLLAMGLGSAASKHGEPRSPDKHNFWATLIASGLIIALLWWGHFFR